MLARLAPKGLPSPPGRRAVIIDIDEGHFVAASAEVDETMRRRGAVLILLILQVCSGPEPACGPRRLLADEELDRHLAELRGQINDPKLDVSRREILALELAGTLDRAGQAAGTVEARRTRWTEAVGLLDRFGARNPRHPRASEFAFQAAVYLWARGQSWQRQAELEPTNVQARADAIRDLDEVLGRLAAVRDGLAPGLNELLEQNVRFRQGQALADRAELDPAGSEARRLRQDEALKALEQPITEPILRGFALLLRAELFARRGRFEPAMEALESAARAKPSPPAADLLVARVEILEGQGKYEVALKAIDAAPLEAPARDGLAVKVLLSQRSVQTSGAERSATESALFRRVAALSAAGTLETREALMELARRLVEPDSSQPPEAYEAVATGALALGDVSRASRLEVRGAVRAESLGQAEQAAAMRLRAGAYLYQARRYAEADTLLTRVVDDPRAGKARADAGMLRALARGSALAQNQPGASHKAYLDALNEQIRDFPEHAATNEARWLLGRLRLAASDRDAAVALWTAITPGTPRWVDARLAIARLNQDDLDTLRITNERPRVDGSYNAARRFLIQTLDQARGDLEKAELELAMVRLELTPLVGHPDEARARCEQVLHAASRPEQRERARRFHLVALAELNRFLEAEKEARDEASQSRPEELLEPARLLDHVASDTESDLRMRRFGLVLYTLLSHALDHPEDLRNETLAELRLRVCRALLFRGDDLGARRSLTAWNGRPPEDNPAFLKDLADTYLRLEAFGMAIDVERLRLKRLANGSLPWFESRYRLALAQYRAGESRAALHLIDATAILHPDLGGGELREKFVRLRQRIGPEQ
jgi:hypothetical protein